MQQFYSFSIFNFKAKKQKRTPCTDYIVTLCTLSSFSAQEGAKLGQVNRLE